MLKWVCFLLSLIGIVEAQLTPQAASDGPCNPNIKNYLAPVDVIFAGIPRNFYVPIGSQALYRHYGEVFLGRPLANEEELGEMQLKIWYALTENTKTTAFPKQGNPPQFTQMCHAHNLDQGGEQVDCKPLEGSPSTNITTPSSSTIDSVVWTDNKTTYLIVRCPSDNIQDYKVLSTNKTISEPAKTVILSRIKEVGFDLKNIYYMNYD